MFLPKLPIDVIRYMFEYLTIKEIVGLLVLCKDIKDIIRIDLFLNKILRDYFFCYLHNNNNNNNNINNKLKINVNSNIELNKLSNNIINNFYKLNIESLLLNVIDYSSKDNEEQHPKNVLTVSLCFKLFHHHPISRTDANRMMLGYFCQQACGCFGRSSCYWSSAPSITSLQNEFIIFNLKYNISIIYAFSITPYQAFFHPEYPIYNSKYVSLQIIMNSKNNDNNNIVLYETELFNIKKLFQVQIFYLKHPIIIFNSNMKIKLILHEMVQRQTLTADQIDNSNSQRPDDYYTCLSAVNVYGIPLIDINIEIINNEQIMINNYIDNINNNIDNDNDKIYNDNFLPHNSLLRTKKWIHTIPYSITNIENL